MTQFKLICDVNLTDIHLAAVGMGIIAWLVARF